jgi:hypothetical protein
LQTRTVFYEHGLPKKHFGLSNLFVLSTPLYLAACASAVFCYRNQFTANETDYANQAFCNDVF